MCIKISMYLMNQKGLYVLKKYIETFSCDYLDCIIVSRDKNVEEDYYEQIINLCRENNICVYDKNDNFIINANVVFAIGWRWLIDVDSNTKIIVFHDSLLPKYRGFAPLVTQLINKNRRIGVTALYACEEYDRGEIIGQKSIEIEYPIKIKNAINIIQKLYFLLFSEIMSKLINEEEIISFPQNEKDASYSLWRDEEDYHIDWSKDSSYIKRFIDSVGFPYKGAYSYINYLKVRVLEAEIVQEVNIENRDIGKIIFLERGKPIIVCGNGLLKLTKVVDDKTKEDILPLKKFRLRFK